MYLIYFNTIVSLKNRPLGLKNKYLKIIVSISLIKYSLYRNAINLRVREYMGYMSTSGSFS